jgi:hypothetical protein
VGAQGIEAEIPQACRRQAEELERKARFFCGLAAKKCSNSTNLTEKKYPPMPWALGRGLIDTGRFLLNNGCT